MSSRDTYISSVKGAAPVKTATLTANEGAKQATINASGVDVGYTTQTGNYANFASAVKSANIAKLNADFLAEQARQATVAAARDMLRATGDLGAL
jgi:hypothetical protein